MSKKKITGFIILGIIAVLVISNVIYDNVYSVYYPEEYAKEKEQRAIEEEQDDLNRREADGFNIYSASDINPDRLSGMYKDRAEMILRDYILSYNGKDNTGWSIGFIINNSFNCEPGDVKILDSDDRTIRFELSYEGYCEKPFFFEFLYTPYRNELQPVSPGLKSIMDVLD